MSLARSALPRVQSTLGLWEYYCLVRNLGSRVARACSPNIKLSAPIASPVVSEYFTMRHLPCSDGSCRGTILPDLAEGKTRREQRKPWCPADTEPLSPLTAA
jgi:hypothetical protein